MHENNKYNPKFSSDPDPWENGSWQTGSTQPPKSRGGLIALMLILIIFLCGIITVLGILNIRLFQKLRIQENNDLAISFTVSQTEAAEETVPDFMEIQAQAESAAETSLELQQSPQGADNIPEGGGLALQDIYTQCIDSVVSITSSSRGGSSTGTGVIFTQSGYIVTNAHVIEDAVAVSVQLSDNRILDAGIVGADEITDLAVLHIDSEDLTPAVFGDSDSLRVGDTVVAIGDPLGIEFRGTYTNGIVSAINRDVEMDGRTMTLIQTNAALNSGNSGGPLINCYGQVIGINTMKIGAFTDHAGVEGLGFAIPSALVKDVVDQLIQQGYVSGRPSIGLEGETLSSFYQHYYRLPAGLYITKVEMNTDAYRKGIENGDILVSINDQRITSMDDLKSCLYTCEIGQVVQAVIYRGGQQYLLDLTLVEDKG